MRNGPILLSQVVFILVIVVLAIDVRKKKRRQEPINHSLVQTLIALTIVEVPSLIGTIYCTIKPASDLLQTTIVMCSGGVAFLYIIIDKWLKKQQTK